MKNNLGNEDKTVRAALALIIGAVGFYLIPIAIGRWGLVAIVPLFTALFSFCPLYTIFDLNTCSTNRVQ